MPIRYIFLLALCLSLKAFSQEISVIPPTPNAMKMTEYHAQRPNLYTGTANVTIPLYTINFDGWQLPLTLSYNATGIRTNEEATEVGLGWALSATGMISRTVVGKDDLFPGGITSGLGRGYVYDEEPVRFDLGFDGRAQGMMGNCNAVPSDTSYYTHLANSQPDTEPDIFNYNFFGYSGSFTLSKKNQTGNVVQVIKITQDATSISFSEDQKTFTIITPEGFRGEFTVKELATSFAGTADLSPANRMLACGENYIDITELVNNSGQYKVITTWYLSKITSPKSKVIDFNYYLNADGSSPYLSNTLAFAEKQSVIDEISTYDLSETCLQNVQEHVYLANISIDGWLQVDFNVEDRLDLRINELFLPGGVSAELFPNSGPLKRYSSIHIVGLDQNSTLDKTILFDQSYFNEAYKTSDFYDANQVEWLRSRLDKVTIDDQEYNFEYYDGAGGLPSKLTRGIDHFGFYNGREATQHLLPPEILTGGCVVGENEVRYYNQHPDRLVDFSYGVAGVLKKVTYPTRGYAEYTYTAHDYIPHQDNIFRENPGIKQAGGTRISSIEEFTFEGELQRSTSYYFKPDDLSDLLNTSGRLATPLMNGYKSEIYEGIDLCNSGDYCWFYTRSNSSIPGSNAAEGKVLGYDKVVEVVEEIGPTGVKTSVSYKNEFHFENRVNEILDFNAGVDGYPNLNGQLISSGNYDETGQLIQHVENRDYVNLITPSIKGLHYKPYSGINPVILYSIGYNIKRSFYTPLTIITTVKDQLSNLVADNDGNIVTLGNAIQTQESLIYNDRYQLNQREVIDSDNNTITTIYKHPSDYTNPSLTLGYMLQEDVNLIAPVIEEVTEKNGQVIGASGKKYLHEGDYVHLKSAYSYNRDLGPFVESMDGEMFPSPYEMRATYNQYDNISDNTLEIESSDGTLNSFIWGYQDWLPIVYGKGVSYTDLSQAYSYAQGQPDVETALREHALTKSAEITTYSHAPLVGVKTVTDPSGQATTYNYDSYGRLVQVIDKDNNTISQNEYHYKEIPLTRILDLSGNLNYGVLVPYDFTPTPPPEDLEMYDRICKNDIVKILTIANSGTDDLSINDITFPIGFRTDWILGDIPPGTSVNVPVIFEPTAEGIYEGYIQIAADETSGNDAIYIYAEYASRICDIQFSTSVLDFGIVTGSFTQLPLDITNNGNSVVALQNIYIDNIAVKDLQNHPDFSISGADYTLCIEAGETKRIYVNYIITQDGISSADLSFEFLNCGYLTNAVHLQGERKTPYSNITLSTNSIDFGNFTEENKSQTVIIGNSGFINSLTVDGVSFSDPNAAQHFILDPAPPYTIEAGGQVSVNLTFEPTNFQQINTNIILDNDAQNYSDAVINFTGSRTAVRDITLLQNNIGFDQNERKYIAITNNGNAPTTLYAMNVEEVDWSILLQEPDGNDVVIQPGQTRTIEVYCKTAEANPFNILITGNFNQGSNVLTVVGNKRELSLVTANADIPDFTGSSTTKNVTISYSDAEGNPLHVYGISSSDGTFTISPQDFIISDGGTKTLTITFTPGDFVNHQTTFTFDAMTTKPFSFTSNGQRTEEKIIALKEGSSTQLTSSLTFSGEFEQKTLRIYNDGNTDLYVSQLTYDFPISNNWQVTESPPFTIAKDQYKTLTITRLGANVEDRVMTIVSDKTGGNNVIALKAEKKLIAYSPASLTFDSFTGTEDTKQVIVKNTGNVALNITNITSSDNRFTTSETSFAISEGGQHTIDVTYTPNDFNQINGTLTFSGDFQNVSNNTISVSGKRDVSEQLFVSPTNLYLHQYSSPSGTVIIENKGNVSLMVDAYNSNNTDFDVEFNAYSAVCYCDPVSFPYTLLPGKKIQAKITYTGYSTTTSLLQIFTSDMSQLYYVNIAADNSY